MFMLNGSPLPLDTPFTHNDIQYPANWLRLTTIEEKQAIGITEVDDPVPYDDRFYWGPNNPKQLEDETITTEEEQPYTQKGLKSNWVAQIKDTAGKLLSATDWMVVRKVERDVPVPEATAAYRTAVVAETTRLEAEILATTTVEQLITVLGTQNWPKNT